ncbi:NO signaling/Golgi transport ligand-binding domain-containing protein [Sparassis latifolia]|uniref:Trafficking protein particle complex subunit 6B n=1 Tax=Sparassis crispa TaxID=139825 RepID=A0A401G8T3_9APHY|nr:predicted protein [Sparassis crispa]GBE78567.1 predicted protein [Sparassis crispa]
MSARTSFQSSASAINPPPSSTAVVPTLNALSDPVVCQIDGPTMDYLLIEVVNALRASSVVAANRARKIEHEMIEAGLIPAPVPVLPVSKDAPRDSVRSNVSRGSKAAGEDDEEAVQVRLEAIGMHVGANLTERLCHDRPLFSDTLDAVKFICKDLWAACWDKQVDNLRTNHRGIYVLQDNAFKPISRISGWEGREDAQKKAKLYVAMPAGIIRGALSRLGFQSAVVPEVTALPQCTFQLKLPKTA